MPEWLGITLVDWVVLAVYLVGITLLGVWSYKKVRDMSDYFMGGRRFGKVFMMFFAFGAGTSGEQAISVTAGAFRHGLAGIWYQFLWLWATPFYWIIAPIFRRMRALTISDFFEARYDSSTSTLYSLLGIAMSVVFIGAALFGSGEMIEGLAGGVDPATGRPYFPKAYAIGAMTVMFVIYGMAGGLGAAIITDFIQGVLTIVFSFLLLPFAFRAAAEVAGVGSGFQALHLGNPQRPDMLSLTLNQELAKRMGQEPITLFYVIMLSLTGLMGIVVQPHIMGVCGAGKTEMEGRFGFTFGNFIKRFCTIAWTFTGLACIVMYLTPGTSYLHPQEAARLQSSPELQTLFSNQVFGRAANALLPAIAPGLVGLLLASLLAAVMSTCDAQMVVSSGLFTENIYKRFIKRQASPRHYLWVGRFSGLAIVALALFMQTQFENVIQVLTTYVQAFPVFMGLAFWFGVTWRGYTSAGVWASTLTTAATWYLTQTHRPLAFLGQLGSSDFLRRNIDYLPWLFRNWLHQVAPAIMIEQGDSFGQANFKTSVPYQILLYISAGAIAGVVVSLMTRRTPPEKLDSFFRLLRTPVRKGEQVASPCRLPPDPLPPVPKLFRHPDVELPRPTLIGIGGFLAAWACVGLIIWLTVWLAHLG